MNHRTRRRFHRRPFAFAVVAAAVTIGGLGAGRVLAQSGDQALDFMLAERLALLGDEAASDPQAPAPVLHEAAAMLDLARKYKPREVRFARSSVDVLLRLGERDRALEALTAVRQLDPRDQLAMIQFIDLTADAMETGEAKADYLRKVADAPGVAPEVRSHAATSLMNLCFARSQDQQGLEAMSQALSLNPQNLVALRVKYDVAERSGDPIERAKALGAIVQASPANASNLIGLAQECAAAGDYENASTYYQYGLAILANSGVQPPVDDFIDFLGVQMLGNQTALAEALVGNSLERLKNEPRLYAIQLMLAIANGKRDVELASQIDAARGVYLAQLARVSQALNEPQNTTPPTTNPAVPMPNVTADAAKLTAEGGDPNNLRGPYTVALAELIWYDAHFRAATVEPATLEAFRTLLGNPNDPLMARLEGWTLLSAGRIDESIVKLSAVADRDGYAKLGLAVAAMLQKDEAKSAEILSKLLADRPTGLYAITVGMTAKRTGIRPPEMTPAERQIAGLAGSLKNPIENLLNNPRSAYVLSARPLTISVPSGEPILAEVRIHNNGQQPITIGPGALIGPRFTVDLATRGPGGRNFPATVVGNWSGPIRVMPQQQLVQVVRIDRGPVGGLLQSFPTALVAMSGSITSNPLVGERGSVPAPGGQQTTIGEGIERRPAPFHVESFRKQVLQNLSNGTPAERYQAADLVSSVVPLLRSQPDNADAVKAADELAAALEARLANETVDELKAVLTLGSAAASADMRTKMEAAVTNLAASDSAVGQATALWIARGMPSELRKSIAQKALSTNPQGPILELAKAVSEQEDLRRPEASEKPADGAAAPTP